MCKKNINILYIEDDSSLRSLVTDLLKRSRKYFDFKLILKTSLTEGMEYLDQKCALVEEREVDIVLLDLILPNSHGVGTFLKIKKQCPEIPIVIVSAHEDIACECVKLGAQDYLIKTELSAPILARSIRYAIERMNVEGMYKDIIKSSPLGYNIFRLIDDEIIFVNYNPASNKILKLDNSQFLNKKLQEAFPGVTDEMYNAYYTTLKDGTPFNMCIEYEDERIPKGHFKIHGHRTTFGDLVLSFENVTEKVYLQEKLIESESKYKQLVEATGAAVYEIDFVNMKLNYVNDIVCEQTGYTKKELMKMSPFDFLTKEGAELFLDRINKLKKGEYIHDAAEYEIIKKDGSSTWIMLTAKYIEDDQGNVVKANVVAIDITDKVLAEKMIKRREAEVFTQLENRIHTWKEEMLQRDVEQRQTLNLINQEINFMSTKSDSEVL